MRELLDDGLLGYSTAAGAWTNHAIDDLLDEGAPHLLAVLWPADELPAGLLVDMVLEIARDSIAIPPASNTELHEIIVRSAFRRLLSALGSVGLHAVNSAQRLSPSAVEPLLRRLLATRSRGHAIAALSDMGADDVPVDR